MENLTPQELDYLIKLLESEKRGGFKSRDVALEVANLNETEIYFLQQKLEKLR